MVNFIGPQSSASPRFVSLQFALFVVTYHFVVETAQRKNFDEKIILVFYLFATSDFQCYSVFAKQVSKFMNF